MRYINKKTGIDYIDINDVGTNGQKFTVVSLFSGAGGLDIGLEQAGFSTVVCVENDINCRETLRHNRPEWKLFESPIWIEDGGMRKREPGDIRDVDTDELLEFADLKKGVVSLVVGGAPCQPFSNIGKKEGKHDKKNGDLFLEFVRMVKGIRPKAFIFENVTGITQQKHSDVIGYMCEKFEGEGYGISHAILNSADYGVPQRRKRFFLVGIKGVKKPAFPMPTHSMDGNAWRNFLNELDRIPQSKPKKWVGVQKAFSEIPTDAKSRRDYALMNISPKVVDRMKLIKQGENFKVLPMNMRPDCWKNGKHQGSDTFGRLLADYPSVTIRTAAYNPGKGRYIHPFENRGLSTIEMAVLQDFPLDWVFRCYGRERVTLVSGGKQVGNAVPPGLARALGLAIKKQMAMVVKKEFVQGSHVPVLSS
ncbi:MAG: DNA (cytosine-5-)-methyltransferase [Bacteroidetes bacterium 4572_114]|nr:MAG: DNA (cytosine-5-)-methyltransferase [Bacteroidetes bacterium 4572_114]